MALSLQDVFPTARPNEPKPSSTLRSNNMSNNTNTAKPNTQTVEAAKAEGWASWIWRQVKEKTAGLWHIVTDAYTAACSKWAVGVSWTVGAAASWWYGFTGFSFLVGASAYAGLGMLGIFASQAVLIGLVTAWDYFFPEAKAEAIPASYTTRERDVIDARDADRARAARAAAAA